LKTAETVEKEHGRIEIRKIAVSAEVVPHLEWPAAAQVARIERTREMSGKVSMETAYIVTSLTAAEAGPERLLGLSRNHWAIENRLHYVRDVTFNEDRCRVRSGESDALLGAGFHEAKRLSPAMRSSASVKSARPSKMEKAITCLW